MNRLANIKQSVKEYQSDIMFFIAIFLIVLLLFALGFIFIKSKVKSPLYFEKYEF